MEGGNDFIKCIGTDMSMNVFMHLECPADLIGVSLVSRSWYKFVVENELLKNLCVRKFYEMPSITCDIEGNNMIESIKDASKWTILERNHKLYSLLAHGLSPSIREDCICTAISASSTDNYPEERIQNTLIPNNIVDQRATYWSSKGSSDPNVSETLMYKLMADMCIVTEVHVQPFQAYFQYGYPIYSSKYVRFRLGHTEYPMEGDILTDEPDNKFICTYMSPMFPMSQENCLQRFKLPKPVLCMGGILQVELIGMVQKQTMDGLYYICVCHAQAVGRPVTGAVEVRMVDSTGKWSLKYKDKDEGLTPCPPRLMSTRVPPVPAALLQGRGDPQHVIVTIFLRYGDAAPATTTIVPPHAADSPE